MLCHQHHNLHKPKPFGFLRLRFPPPNHNPVYPILKNKALIRELHVYGTTNSVGSYNTSTAAAQHKGIGTKLLKIAERIALRNFYNGIVVISGEGVKTYYTKRGYQEIDTYMVKSFHIFRYMILIIMMIIVLYCIGRDCQ